MQIFKVILIFSTGFITAGSAAANSSNSHFKSVTWIRVTSQQQTQPILLRRTYSGMIETLSGLAVLNETSNKIELHFTRCFRGKKPVICNVDSIDYSLDAPPVTNASTDIQGRILLAQFTSGFSDKFAETFENQIVYAIKSDRIRNKWTFQTTHEDNDPLQIQVKSLLQQSADIREDAGRAKCYKDVASRARAFEIAPNEDLVI